MANQNKNTIQNKSSHNEEKQNRDKNIQTTEFVNIITEQMNRGSKRLNFFVKLLPIWDEKTQLLKHKPRILLESWQNKKTFNICQETGSLKIPAAQCDI